MCLQRHFLVININLSLNRLHHNSSVLNGLSCDKTVTVLGVSVRELFALVMCLCLYFTASVQ